MPSKDIPVQILVSLAAAALWGFVQGESMSVLGTLQIGYFEVAFLVALCVMMVLARVVLPWLNGWLLEPGRRDREDFSSLVGDAKKVREGYDRGSDYYKGLPKEEKDKAINEQHDLEVHLQLLEVQFFTEGQNLFRDLALLIKLMERGDLQQARKRWPKPQGSWVDPVPS